MAAGWQVGRKTSEVMVYKDRAHAGEKLAGELLGLKLDPKSTVIAAIPRGGVVVGEVIARRLSVPLKVVVVKKLGAPNNSELAIGATASFGRPVLDLWLIRDLGASRDYLKREIAAKRKQAAAREALLGVVSDQADFFGKNVIVVDDGIATGQTVRAAALILHKFGALLLILAVGCASPSVIDGLRKLYDEIVCPIVDPMLSAVGQYYEDFREISDEEAKEILNIK